MRNKEEKKRRNTEERNEDKTGIAGLVILLILPWILQKGGLKMKGRTLDGAIKPQCLLVGSSLVYQHCFLWFSFLSWFQSTIPLTVPFVGVVTDAAHRCRVVFQGSGYGCGSCLWMAFCNIS